MFSSITTQKKQYQRGFALLEVVISTLVLAIGIVAFVKLQNSSVQRLQQVNHRLQATASANALVEILRSHHEQLQWLIDNDQNTMVVTAKPTGDAAKSQCVQDELVNGNAIDVKDPGSWCDVNGDAIRSDLVKEMNRIFSANFGYAVGKAVMCLRADTTQSPTPVRVMVLWKNANSSSTTTASRFTPASIDDCPDDYFTSNEAINEKINVVNPDRGFFELYTRI